MAHQLMRPLRHQWPRLHRHCSPHPTLHHHHLHSSSLLAVNTTAQQRLPFITVPVPHRSVHFRSRGLKLANPVPTDIPGNDFSDSDSDAKSRNDKKRDARRAVRWGMDLASFSNSQIKRILSVAALEQEVFDALMLVKGLRPDVREGKRRQYNYIGKLLRKAEPELMDKLIQATKDGDHSVLQSLSASGMSITGDDDQEVEKIEYEEEEEISLDHIDIDMATRWFDGLINKSIDITNEIYSIHSIDFDRQELRRLIRKVHSIQEQQDNTEENKGEVDVVALKRAKKSLTHFLRSLAKRMPNE